MPAREQVVVARDDVGSISGQPMLPMSTSRQAAPKPIEPR